MSTPLSWKPPITTRASTPALPPACAPNAARGNQYRRPGEKLRSRDADRTKTAEWLATHFATALQGARFTLHVANGARMLLGAPRLAKLSASVTKLSKGQVPQWTPAMPQPESHSLQPGRDGRAATRGLPGRLRVTRHGPGGGDKEQMSLYDKTRNLLEKAGYQVVFPDNQDSLCCGQPFASKGYAEQAEHKRQELIGALLHASRGGLDPIYCDTSPCTLRLVQDLSETRLDLYDPVRFIRTHLMDRLDFTPQEAPIAVHVTCSTQHLGESQALIDLARRCSNTVVIPEGIHCCGFAGDKGFTTPELNAHSLRTLKDAVQYCSEGISTSRTCEIGLSQHGGIDYHGLVYLVDRVTQARAH